MIEVGMVFVILVAAVIVFLITFIAKQYKRCPSNRILVVYGNVTGNKAAKCLHGGGTFVIPLIQDYAYLSLEPITIDIALDGALSKKNIRVNVPSTFTVGISTDANIMTNAAERLLGLSEADTQIQARDIILGQLRLVIATLSIEEINQDREKFLDLINLNVNTELNKIGLEVINVNIRDITDESGYIEAIGKKAAAEAINKAKVEVAQQDKDGAIGEASAFREKDVSVAQQHAQAEIGQKAADREKRITIASLEAEGQSGEAEARRIQDVAIAEQKAKAVQGSKKAESEQRVFVANQEAEAVKGENTSKAQIALYQAELREKEAEADRRADIAMAEAKRDILRAQKEQEVAQLEKETLAKQEVEKRRLEVQADAKAEAIRREAKGEADAVLLKYKAEAEGILEVLNAKAAGYEKLMLSCGDKKHLAPTLLMVEKLPELVAEQVKAIQNLKIDKITVWDSAGGSGKPGEGSTANFLRSLATFMPPLHGLAKQAGVELPEFLGVMNEEIEGNGAYNGSAHKGSSSPTSPPPTA